MWKDSLAFRTARTVVRTFKSEGDEILARHYEAHDCVECENFLELGIEACKWLQKAGEGLRRLIASGQIEPSAEYDDALEVLYRLWLPPLEIANQRIEVQRKNGYRIENLEEFRCCEKLVREVVDRADAFRRLSAKVPSADELNLIAADPKEWLNQPSWPLPK